MKIELLSVRINPGSLAAVITLSAIHFLPGSYFQDDLMLLVENKPGRHLKTLRQERRGGLGRQEGTWGGK